MRDPRVLSLFLSTILICGGATSAQERPEPKWAESSTGCKFLDPYWVPNTVYTWTGGPCVDGYVSGDGSLVMTGVMRWLFKGTFKEGRMVSGTVTFPAGSYTGTLKDNLAEGPGVFRYRSGIVIEGTFAQGYVSGDATVTYDDGARYVGTLSPRNEPHGKGRLTDATGSVYEGEFVDGSEQGHGTLTYADGGSYEGAFLAGVFSGEGEMRDADGTHYVGQFRAGKRQGHGTLQMPNGDEYVGDFILDHRHGAGRYVLANGQVLEGDWKNDQLNGKCQVSDTGGLRYSGACVSGKFHGEGRLTSPGYSYEGAFVAGLKHGRGKEGIADVEQYEGEFVRGVREGQGTLRLTHPGGKEQVTLTGEFRGGQLYRGTLTDKSGRKFEFDLEQDSILEILPDGSKRPASPAEVKDLPI